MLWFRTPEKVYFKKGCMPVALRELKEVYGCKRAFIVTDSFLYTSGFTKKIEKSLDEQTVNSASRLATTRETRSTGCNPSWTKSTFFLCMVFSSLSPAL